MSKPIVGMACQYITHTGIVLAAQIQRVLTKSDGEGVLPTGRVHLIVWPNQGNSPLHFSDILEINSGQKTECWRSIEDAAVIEAAKP